MVRIKVDPSELQTASKKLLQKAQDLKHLADVVTRINGTLRWSASEKQSIDNLINKADHQASDLASKMEEFGRRLNQAAAAFLEADNQGVASLANLPPSGGAPWWMNRIISLEDSLSFIAYLPRAVQEMLANILMPINPYLPSGVFSFIAIPLMYKPEWIPGMASLDSQYSKPGKLVEEQSGFGELLQKEYPPSPSDTYVDHNVPYHSQKDLMFDPQTPTDWGCVPTSTGMILDYWHNRDPNNKTLTTQELLDLNIEDRDFTQGQGMGLDEIADELSDLGYSSNVSANSNKDALVAAVKEGPVIAQINLNMRAGGTDHAVVVTGFSKDGNNVLINDPWNNRNHSYTWDQFSTSWSTDHESYENIFLTIRPN